MPFKSKAQQRWMFSAENKGELPKGTAERWAEHTPDIKALPEHKMNKTASEIADDVIEKVAAPRWLKELGWSKNTVGRVPGVEGPMRDIAGGKKDLARLPESMHGLVRPSIRDARSNMSSVQTKLPKNHPSDLGLE
jgi:hypothetical protein